MKKPILCVDFDGVIHDYRQGWQGGVIYGNVTHGFFEWLQKAYKSFDITVYSSRSATQEGRNAMRSWIVAQGAKFAAMGGTTFSADSENDSNLKIAFQPGEVIHLNFSNVKPPAFLTIDDRSIRFNGYWTSLDPEDLIRFTSWTQKGT